MRTLQWCFSASLLEAGCKLVSLNGLSPILLSCQGDCGICYACAVLGRNLAQENTLWENPVILALLFPKVETFLDGGNAFAYAS